jgi:hypothetical protein
MDTVSLTRAELYTLVWSEPLSVLAERFNLSDYGMRKICIDLSVPLPRTGHWKRVRAGQPVDIPPLPSVAVKQQIVKFSVHATGTVSEKPVSSPRQTLDPLLAAVKQTLTRKENAYLHDGLRHSDQHQLDIRAAPQNVDRALRFMNQFLHALRGRGHSIEGSHVLVNGQKMGIRCREKLKRVASTKYSYQHTELVPTGILSFQLTAEWSWQPKEWKEGTETLEEKIPTILEKMESESRRLAEEDRQRQQRQAERAEEERIRKEQEQRKQSELTGFQALFTQATRWRRALDLRDYLAAFEQHARTFGTLTTDQEAWLAWARAKADWYDPFLESPDEWLADIDQHTLQKKKTHGTF